MKLKLFFCQIFVISFSLHTTQHIRPRRIFENLGKIHDAIHELTGEGPEDEMIPRRENRHDRFKRTLNRHDLDWPLMQPVMPFGFPSLGQFDSRPRGHGGPPDRPFRGPRFDPRTGLPLPRGPGRGRNRGPGRGRFGGRRRGRPHPDRNRESYDRNELDRPNNDLTETTADSDQDSNDRSSSLPPNRNNNNNHHITKPINNQPPRSEQPLQDPSTAQQIDWEAIEKVCGLRSAARIVGGKETKPNSWLWMAALIKNDESKQNYCGGVLITSIHVLTAAHCLQSQTPDDMFVRLGEYDFARDGSTTSEDHEVDYFIIHSGYDMNTHENDISILKLKEEAQFTHFIRPVCLPKKSKDYTNEIATVVGYGSTSTSSNNKVKLREVSLPVWRHSDCEDAYSANFSSGQMCAGFREGGRDSCQGDSGGPLMLQGNKQKWTAIGIVSFGIGCGQAGYPGVYTRINKYTDWIRTNTN